MPSHMCSSAAKACVRDAKLACCVRRARAMPSFPEGGGVVGVQMLPISWGADHRVLDGAALAKFNLTFKALIETPEQLLMHLR